MRVLFEGEKYKIIDANSKEINTLMGSGIIKQVNGMLFDDRGRLVIISKKGITAHAESNPFPFLLGKTVKNDLKMYIMGSVARADKIVVTNYHVLSKAHTLIAGDKRTKVSMIEYYKPVLMSRLAFSLLNAFKQVFHIDLIPRSRYDYAVGIAREEISNYKPSIDLIYFAGTCSNIVEDNCFGFALPTPLNDLTFNPYELIGSSFSMNCTAHALITQGQIVDYGKVVVNYGNKLALFNDAFMLKFIGSNGVPGCSGSAVTVKTVKPQSECNSEPYSAVVTSKIEIKKLGE